MPRVYAIASAKGGVGKTTTTANVAATLADAGADVVVIDGDLGMANLAAALGVDPDGPTLHDVLSGAADPTEAVYTGPNGLRIVPGATALDAFSDADPRGLEAVISAFPDAEFVLIDVGAGLSYETSLPLSVADEVVLVSTADRDALVDTEKTRRLTERLDGSVRGAVITRVDPGVPVADLVERHLDAPILATVPEDEAVRESVAAGEPLTTYAPHSAAAGAYRTLTSELTGIEPPDPPEPPAAYRPDPIEGRSPAAAGAEESAETDVERPADEPPSVDDPDPEEPADDSGTAGQADDPWAEAARIEDDMIVAESDPDAIVDETPTMTAVGSGVGEDSDDSDAMEAPDDSAVEEDPDDSAVEEDPDDSGVADEHAAAVESTDDSADADEPVDGDVEAAAGEDVETPDGAVETPDDPIDDAIPFQESDAGADDDTADAEEIDIPDAESDRAVDEPAAEGSPDADEDEDEDDETEKRGFFSRLFRS